MYRVLKEVFSQKRYITSFISIVLLCWVLVGIYQHGKTVWSLYSVLPLAQWLLFVADFSSFIINNASTLVLFVLIFNILNIAFYITMKIYAYQLQAKTRSAVGVIGSILVFFGIGCASCGSLALISIASFVGFGGAVAILPFGGSEIIFVASVLLIFSNIIMLRQLAKKVCPV